MQLEIQLSNENDLPLSYSYYHELAAALLQIIGTVNPKLAKDFHDGSSFSRLKAFQFSPLNSDPKPLPAALPNGTNGLKFGKRIWMRTGSAWPELLYSLGEGLTSVGKINLRGLLLKVCSVEMVKTPQFRESMIYRPFGQNGSIICRYELDKKTFFQYPDNRITEIPGCAHIMEENLRHKLLRLKEIRPDIFENLLSISNLSSEDVPKIPIRVEFLPLSAELPFRTYLHQIKTISVRSFRAPFRLTAPEAVHRTLWDFGAGQNNSMGFGLIQQGEIKPC